MNGMYTHVSYQTGMSGMTDIPVSLADSIYWFTDCSIFIKTIKCRL